MINLRYRLYMLYKLMSSVLLTRGIFLLYLVQEKELSIFQVSFCQSLYFILVFLFEIPTGYVSDRFGKAKGLLIGCILIFCQSIILLISPPKMFICICICVFFEAVGNTFFSGTEGAFFYELLEKDNNEKKYLDLNSKIMFFSSIITGLSILIGGYVSEFSWNLVYILTIVVRFSLIIIVLFLLKFENTENSSNSNDIKQNFKISLLKDEIIYSPKRIFIFIVVTACLLDGFFQTYFNFNQLILEKISVNNKWISSFFALMYFSGAVAYPLGNFMNRKIGSKLAILYSILSLTISYGLMTLNINTWTFMILSIVVCFIPEIIYMLVDNFIQSNISSDYRATILSITSLVTSLFASMFYLILGSAFNKFQITNIIRMLCIIFFIILIAGIYFVKKLKTYEDS